MADTAVNRAPEGRKKKFAGRDIVVCVAVLAVIAVVAGVLLGVMNWLTYVDPEQAIIDNIANTYGIEADAVVPRTDRLVNGGANGEVARCFEVQDADGNTVYVYHAIGKQAKSGKIELLVHISEDGIVRDVEEYAQSETAGYFKKVFEANRGKYVGADITLISSFELNGAGDNGVDAVTNATLTSRGINNAVNAAVYAFNHFAGNIVECPERLINDPDGNGSVKRCYKMKNADGETVYVYQSEGEQARNGTLQLLVHISENGIIKALEEFSQSETEGFFKKAFEANRDKYIGVDITLMDGFVLNGTGAGGIDAVTNATMTSRGINNAVNAAVYAFNNYEEAAV